MRRMLWLFPIVGAVACLVLLGSRQLASAPPANAENGLVPAIQLPMGNVVLYSSGVGYFERTGTVTGDTRIDLTFQERDINDLLKSMVLQDRDGGQVEAVSYDSREPVGRTLASFAINLNDNPTYADLLNQARGEQVEVVLQQSALNQPGSLTGTIVGTETKQLPLGKNEQVSEVEVLNLWCADGLHQLKVDELLRLRFVNAELEEEFRRALAVLALTHDAQKKSVSVHFAGEGDRRVSVGYVVEHPVWKTSYRLVLDGEGAEAQLQGWAMVENPTDEDWRGVNMALVSGRPISFRMNLYDPLYVQRPMVEPELFASLRPPTYEGDLGDKSRLMEKESLMEELHRSPQPPTSSAARGGRATRESRNEYFARPSGELRKEAAEFGAQLGQRMELGQGVASAATAAQLGDSFQYIIDRPVNLERQKSALLPILQGPIQAERVSIYNEGVQPKHPLLGLKLKNTSGAHLMQGPITVFEGSTYAGDSRVLDVQPNEERLISYAIDLGTEVSPKAGKQTAEITEVKVVKGVVWTKRVQRQEREYTIANRSEQNRVVLVEHPNRKDQGFELLGDQKPEETRNLWRFRVPVTAGKTQTLDVVEERELSETVALTNAPANQLRYFIKLRQSSPALKRALTKALELKGLWDETRRSIQQTQERIQTITKDQERLRANLREMPREAQAYKRYLAKFDEQEQEMDQLHAKLKELQGSEELQQAAYETYLRNLNVS